MLTHALAVILALLAIDQTPATAPTPDANVQVESAIDQPNLTVDEALDLARHAIDLWVASKDPVVREQAGVDLDRGLAIVKTKSPDHPWLPYLYAFVSLGKGQSWDAVDHLRDFVRTRDGRTEWKAYRTLGDLVVEQFPRLARSHYDKAASLIDGEPTVLYGLSRCAANVGDYAEALDFAKQTVSADREKSVAHLAHLARIARLRKDWGTAVAAAEEAMSVAQHNVTTHPGEREPLLAVNAQYKLLIETETAQLKDLRDPEEVATGFMKLAGYARDRAKTVALLSKQEVVAVLEAGLKRLGTDASVGLLEQTVAAYDDVGRHAAAVDICHRILTKQPDNALAIEWLAKLGEPVQPTAEDVHGGAANAAPDQ